MRAFPKILLIEYLAINFNFSHHPSPLFLYPPDRTSCMELAMCSHTSSQNTCFYARLTAAVRLNLNVSAKLLREFWKTFLWSIKLPKIVPGTSPLLPPAFSYRYINCHHPHKTLSVKVCAALPLKV